MLLDVRADHLKIVQEILRKFIPEREVWAFGSRAKWLAKEYSDLDLCIVGDSALSFRTLGLLEEAFEDSDLPYKVDVVDWATTSESFRKIIERDRVVVQEVGRGWDMSLKTETLASMCEAVVDCPHSTPIWTDSGFVVLRNQNIKDGRLDLTTPSYTDEEHFKHRTRRLAPRAGDIVITREAPMGEVCKIPVGIKCCLGQRQVLLRPKSDIDPDYLLYALQSPFVKNQIRWNEGTGSTVSNIRIPVLEKIEIPRHGDAESKIAKILSSVDAKIALNRSINQTLEAMAQAIFKSWFVDFDPVKAKIAAKQEGRDPLRPAMSAISGKLDTELDALPCEQYEQLATTAALFPDEMEESELGEIPKGWEVVSLYDTADYLNGAAFRASDFSEATEALPIIKIAELKQGINSGTKRTLKEIDQKYKIESGDVLYSWSGSPDTSLEVFRWFGDKGLLNQHIFKLSFTQLGQREYTYYLLKEIKPILVATATQKQTTGLGHITVADMKRIKVTRPKLTELIHFTKQLIQIYATTANHERQSITLAALRDTLLPKLLSGELSVKNILPESEATT